MRYLLDDRGITQFYEIGPGGVDRAVKTHRRRCHCENIPA